MPRIPGRQLIAVPLTYSLLWTSSAYAWWETGHRTTARIAANHLTPAARTQVAHLLDVPNTSDSVADALSAASTWADETKSETKTGPWHFIDLTLEDGRQDMPDRCQNDNCAPARIRIFAAQLHSEVSNAHATNLPSTALDALRYVVHLVGDIHQPLHTISDADLGGNCELLDPPIDSAKNLHALWDGGILSEMNTDDRVLTADLEKQIQKLTNTERGAILQGDQDDWVWESHVLAEHVVYQRLHIPLEPILFPQSCKDAPEAITEFKAQIDQSYLNDMKPVIRRQLLKAGLRLARLLNDSLTPPSYPAERPSR